MRNLLDEFDALLKQAGCCKKSPSYSHRTKVKRKKNVKAARLLKAAYELGESDDVGMNQFMGSGGNSEPSGQFEGMPYADSGFTRNFDDFDFDKLDRPTIDDYINRREQAQVAGQDPNMLAPEGTRGLGDVGAAKRMAEREDGWGGFKGAPNMQLSPEEQIEQGPIAPGPDADGPGRVDDPAAQPAAPMQVPANPDANDGLSGLGLPGIHGRGPDPAFDTGQQQYAPAPTPTQAPRQPQPQQTGGAPPANPDANAGLGGLGLEDGVMGQPQAPADPATLMDGARDIGVPGTPPVDAGVRDDNANGYVPPGTAEGTALREEWQQRDNERGRVPIGTAEDAALDPFDEQVFDDNLADYRSDAAAPPPPVYSGKSMDSPVRQPPLPAGPSDPSAPGPDAASSPWDVPEAEKTAPGVGRPGSRSPDDVPGVSPPSRGLPGGGRRPGTGGGAMPGNGGADLLAGARDISVPVAGPAAPAAPAGASGALDAMSGDLRDPDDTTDVGAGPGAYPPTSPTPPGSMAGAGAMSGSADIMGDMHGGITEPPAYSAEDAARDEATAPAAPAAPAGPDKSNYRWKEIDAMNKAMANAKKPLPANATPRQRELQAKRIENIQGRLGKVTSQGMETVDQGVARLRSQGAAGGIDPASAVDAYTQRRKLFDSGKDIGAFAGQGEQGTASQAIGQKRHDELMATVPAQKAQLAANKAPKPMQPLQPQQAPQPAQGLAGPTGAPGATPTAASTTGAAGPSMVQQRAAGIEANKPQPLTPSHYDEWRKRQDAIERLGNQAMVTGRSADQARWRRAGARNGPDPRYDTDAGRQTYANSTPKQLAQAGNALKVPSKPTMQASDWTGAMAMPPGAAPPVAQPGDGGTVIANKMHEFNQANKPPVASPPRTPSTPFTPTPMKAKPVKAPPMAASAPAVKATLPPILGGSTPAVPGLPAPKTPAVPAIPKAKPKLPGPKLGV